MDPAKVNGTATNGAVDSAAAIATKPVSFRSYPWAFSSENSPSSDQVCACVAFCQCSFSSLLCQCLRPIMWRKVTKWLVICVFHMFPFRSWSRYRFFCMLYFHRFNFSIPAHSRSYCIFCVCELFISSLCKFRSQPCRTVRSTAFCDLAGLRVIIP